MEDFFNSIEFQYNEQLPFVVYRKPREHKVNAILQPTNDLHFVNDFSETGFVFAPFDASEKAVLFPLDHFFLPSNFIAQDFTFAFGLSTILFMLYYIAYALNTVLLSTHFAKLTYIISAAQSIVTLLGIYIFMYSGIKPSFIIIFGWFSGIPLLVWTIANIAIYRKTLIAYRPNFSRVFSKKVFPLQKMNWGFFIIQFCILIIFSTDNFIIINKLTGTEVLKYNVAFKYFNILIVVFNLILLPYWSSFTEAAATKNKKWIKHHISKLLLIWVGLAVGAILLFILSASVYELWIGKDLNISNALSIFMGVSILLTAWNSIFAYFLNALSETKVQMTLLLFSAGMNIPLSLYLINEYNTKGVIIATCIALLPLSIALPIQYKTILNKMK